MKLSFVKLVASASTLLFAGYVHANESSENVPDSAIAEQRSILAIETSGAGYGPQSPRDIGSDAGSNPRVFEAAPSYRQMNLCNIHFHEGAEHKGGQFTKYAGNGDGEGYGSGYLYSGE